MITIVSNSEFYRKNTILELSQDKEMRENPPTRKSSKYPKLKNEILYIHFNCVNGNV